MSNATRDSLIRAAYANDQGEAEIIQGLLDSRGIKSTLKPLGIVGTQVGVGLLPKSPYQVMVHSSEAERAEAIIAERLGTDEVLERDAEGRQAESAGSNQLRNYGVIGAYTRACLVAGAAFGVFLVFFLLLHGS